MEHLQYVIEDGTIAELLGVQNFTSDESAVLELVKNAYDAKALKLVLEFNDRQLIITDDGEGMSAEDIRDHWMHVGKSTKLYEIKMNNQEKKRILAGSKGIGRFALSRLGRYIKVYTKKKKSTGVIWTTDWNGSTLEDDNSNKKIGTKIVINDLRENWGKRKISNLISFLSKTYNDDSMQIEVISPEINQPISKHIIEPKLGINCLSNIELKYKSKDGILSTIVNSDEFVDKAQNYCIDTNIKHYTIHTNMTDELKNSDEFDLTTEELRKSLKSLGDFSACLYFNVNSTRVEMEKFLYKYASVPNEIKSGIILYRNAFSISSYEGKKDWLGLGKRSRKSPAAASHPTGSWRVRENQLSGKVEIDKKRNAVLQDLSNRQGLDENIYYQLFVHIVLTGIKEFERYRQRIIRAIDKKNKNSGEEKATPISDRIASNPRSALNLTISEARTLAQEIKSYKSAGNEYKKERTTVEERYKYDVRILNVLATIGLKASSIAHEMRNDRNFITANSVNIIEALKEYGMWEELNSPEKTGKEYKNVPKLIERNEESSKKIIVFMDTMLEEIEKKQFQASWQSVYDIIMNIKERWEQDYVWVSILIVMEDDICYFISEDIIRVVFDNLILNSIQQNERNKHLYVKIEVKNIGGNLQIEYCDNGKGLDEKYKDNPRKILEVHETTRQNGHGLGMWIVNNTVITSGGEIDSIDGNDGFKIQFTLGGKDNGDYKNTVH